ncbi:major facilitator superfamily domain-containing protein [Mycena metata]|uniref:Major facilitator superfamily domain-containing protein n=1 Tax=Mycena metata TaxID=1033252 RepID=A0AAD7HWR3_9AGAR|nr:major facilitator superfamily domain-containing protein [Mycena metata]
MIEAAPLYMDKVANSPMDNASAEKIEEVQDDEDFPEGGKGWIVLASTVAGFFATFGYVNSWGVFQAYYQQKLLHHSTPSQISWIGSVQHAMIFICALFVGRLFDIGYYRVPFAAGGALILFATFLVPQCTEYWQFLLCQGFCIGIGSGLMFCTMITVVTHWFQKRRGFALGVTSCGGAIGATVQPIILRQLIDRVGFPWAVRTLGFILLFFLAISNLCIARRLPPVKAPGDVLGLHVFRNAAFSIFCVATLISLLGLFTMSTYISSSALAFGISPGFVFYLVAIVNFSAGVGRVISGLLGDRYGPMNIMTIMTALAGVATIAWPFCRTIPTITIISILYGAFSGAWIALIGSAVGQMGGMEDIGHRIGVVNFFAGISAICGPPISGLFVDTSLGYIAVGYFAGCSLLVASSLVFVSRWVLGPGFWRRY